MPPNNSDAEEEDWTPTRGMIRAAFSGSLTALIIATLPNLVAWYAATVVLNWWLRAAVSFGVCLLLFTVVHRTAGMAGSACTILVVVLSSAVMLSQHLIFAIHGVQTPRGLLAGWIWCYPATLTAVNVPTLLGIGLCTLICHGGGAVSRTIIDILTTRHSV